VESGASFGRIADNDAYANTGSGIYVLSGQFITVVGNNCSDNRQSGIGINSAVIPHPGRLTITGNVCNENVFDGIDVNEAGSLTPVYASITGNFLGSNGPPPGGGGTGIILAHAANVVIAGNTITNNSVAGIWMDHSSHNAVSANVFTNYGTPDSQGYGIEERDASSDYNSFVGNTLDGDPARKIQLFGPNDLKGLNR
jgi:parallel beta-helix repeat protein